MKIARPKAPETQFRRKRSPPPQATKLLLYSLTAGLIFMGTLAIVFIPRYLETPQPAVEIIELHAIAGGRLNVTAPAFQLDVAKFNATLYTGNATVASLPAGLSPGGGTLSFTDANGDGKLGNGDFFTIRVTVAASYRLEVWQVDVGRLVGLFTWTGVLS